MKRLAPTSAESLSCEALLTRMDLPKTLVMCSSLIACRAIRFKVHMSSSASSVQHSSTAAWPARQTAFLQDGSLQEGLPCPLVQWVTTECSLEAQAGAADGREHEAGDPSGQG